MEKVGAGEPGSGESMESYRLGRRAAEAEGSLEISGKLDERCLWRGRLRLVSSVRSYCLLREYSGGTALVVWIHYYYLGGFAAKEEQN